MWLRSTIVAVAAMVLAFLAAPLADRANAQEGVEINVLSDAPRNDFPTGVTFTLSFTAPRPPDEVRIGYNLAPDGVGATAIAECDGTTTINCSYTLTSGRGIFVIPGAEITYNWELTFDGDGAETRTSTDERLYVHTDTRFAFTQISEGNVTVYYHPGVAGEAPSVLQAAIEALGSVGALQQTSVDFPVKVFLYETAEEMTPAIISGGAGQGVQILGEVVYSDTAMVSADTATLDIVRHEIAHIVTREATKGPFDIPGWLNEGTSVFVQNQPLPGHANALEAAIRGNRVLTMPELNSSSSGGSAGTVGLYYGQAGSIVAHLVNTYGEEKFAELLRTFKEGSRVDAAFEAVYGFDSLGLENEWRESVGLPARTIASTATADVDDSGSDATPAAGDGEASGGSGDGDDANAINYAIIGVLAVAVLGAVVYSANVIRSRL